MAPLSTPNRSDSTDERCGPEDTRKLNIRYDAGWSSSCTARARSPITRFTRRIRTPTSCSRRPSSSARDTDRYQLVVHDHPVDALDGRPPEHPADEQHAHE